MKQKKKIVGQWLTIVLGLLVFSFGVHLTIYANIGLAPWDCLGMGISYHTPLNYGLAITGVSVAVLLVDVLLGEKIGFGTIWDALLTGNFVEMFNQLNPFPENHSLWLGVAAIFAGLVFMAVGQYIYMQAAQGCGPRDTLLIGLGRRMSGLPIGIVEVLLWAAVLLAGWLLGGPVGLGTLISTFGAGIVMQIIYSAIHFEPRKIEHLSAAGAIKILMKKETVEQA